MITQKIKDLYGALSGDIRTQFSAIVIELAEDKLSDTVYYAIDDDRALDGEDVIASTQDAIAYLRAIELPDAEIKQSIQNAFSGYLYDDEEIEGLWDAIK